MDETLTTVQHGLAYSSDKLLNLQILLMEITDRSSEMESLFLDLDSVPEESVQHIFEFDVLSGFLKSEVKELDKCVVSLQHDMANLHGRFGSEEEASEESKNKLTSAEESLKSLLELLDDIDKQSAKFEETLDLLADKSRSSEGNTPHSDQLLFEGKTMSSKKQRQVLHMLEKSLAREMDLETRLGEAISTEEELKLKLHNLQRESFFLEEYMESLYERTFEGENASDLLLGISKELLGKLNSMQHVYFLRVKSLERQLCESKNEIRLLEGQVSETKTKAEGTAAMELNEANMKLKNEVERGNMLERKMKDSETQLEHAKASLDAVLEQQSMLKYTMSDMEILIKDLKGKVMKAETRAEVAESRLNALNETNLELNEELGFLRGKVEMLEGSLSEVNSAKVATAKSIGIKTKTIANLVTKLAFERERLQIQVAKLTEKNKIMVRHLKRNEGFDVLNKEASTASSTHIHVKDCTVETVRMREAETTVPAEEESGTDSSLESVRDIGPKMSCRKYIFSTFLVVFVLFLVYFMNQNGN